MEYNGVTSSYKSITCGVPQGSTLGPLLFLLYINDLASVSTIIFSILFADDSNLFISGKDPNKLITTMNTEITKVVEWLKINKLSLNLKKTHFMIFRKNREKVMVKSDLIVSNTVISMVQKTKFLGVIIDPRLNFFNHIQYIKSKVARGIGILYKCRKFFSSTTLLTLYYSFIYPYLNYCNNIWGNTFCTYLEPLVKLQKKAIRIIANEKRNAHTGNLFIKFNVLDMKKLYVYCVQLFMFKFYHHLVPNIFDNFYTINSDVHPHFTRQSSLLHVAKAKTKPKLTSIRITGVKTFNFYHDIIDMNCSIITYKKKLKYHLKLNDVSGLV